MSVSKRGRLQAYFNGSWRLACDSGLLEEQRQPLADVVCRQLGFKADGPALTGQGGPEATFYMAFGGVFGCNGDELGLFQCNPYRYESGIRYCGSNNYVEIHCQ